jgi:hypothetical protein
MNRRTLIAATVVSIILNGLVSAIPERVPGTRVTLDAPPGFASAEQFPGFQNAADQASILVSELPGSAVAMKRGMTRAALASRGMTLLESSTAAVDGQDVLLLHVRQGSPAGHVLKWMLIGGDARRTVMIVGTYPADGDAGVGDQIKSALLGARLGVAANSPDPFEGLPFRISPTPRLKIAGRVTNLLTLTETGTMTPGNPDAALYFVGHSIGNAPISDLAAFSRRRLAQTTRTRGISNVRGEPATLDGMDAYELEAEATDTQTARPVHIYQMIAPDEGGYFIIQGLVTPGRAAEMVPEFRSVTATFRRSTRQ